MKWTLYLLTYYIVFDLLKSLLDFTGECGSINDFAIRLRDFGLRARNCHDEDYDYVDTDSDYSY